MNTNKNFQIIIAGEQHAHFASELSQLIEAASKARGTGIAKRSPDYLAQKMIEGKAIIASQDEVLAGFCYIESWGHGAFVANSGLVVKPEFRKTGLARKIKTAIFELSREKYPNAKIFGITTSLAVMKINSGLGYQPVTFSELTTDEAFWQGCQGCVNYDILQRTNRKHCLCTGMAYTPDKTQKRFDFDKHVKLYSRWLRYKRSVLFRRRKRKASVSAK